MDHPRNRLAPLRNESKLRRESFENGWPADKNFLSIDTFVNQGFYFLGVGNGDRVQCVYCAGVISQWEVGDNIETEHRRNFPQCPLMKRPMKNPSYRDLSTRKLSFQGWPPQISQKPDDLAEAGLFYLGHGDKTKCFWCSGMISGWEPTDIPIVEHAKFFPQCQWLIASKGKEFIERIQQHVQQGIPFQDLAVPTETNPSSQPHEAFPVSSAQAELLRMGFDPLVVNEASKHLDSDTINVQSLMHAILEIQSGQASGYSANNIVAVPTETNPSSQPHEAFPVSSAQAEVLRMGFDPLVVNEASKYLDSDTINVQSLVHAILEIQSGQASGYSANNIDVGSLARENEAMKGKTMCKICGQQQVKIVFMPCGHLVCCLECGQQITHCPVCSNAITQHIPVYI